MNEFLVPIDHDIPASIPGSAVGFLFSEELFQGEQKIRRFCPLSTFVHVLSCIPSEEAPEI